MASDHTRWVRLEIGSDFPGPPRFYKKGQMVSIKQHFFKILSEKHITFSLRRCKAIDIKPIGKIDVSAIDPRHCSTTFYQ